MRPLTYWDNRGAVLGHYSVAQRSGNIAAAQATSSFLASIRWAPTTLTAYLVLMRIRVAIGVTTSSSTLTEHVVAASIVRGFSVDFTTAATQISMSGVANTQKMRAAMGTSLMGTAGPQICTTTTMSGQTLTADTAPFGFTTFPSVYPSTATGTAAVIPAGYNSQLQTLYEWTGLGQHPVILSNNEGVVIKPLASMGGTSQTTNLYVLWEWAEVVAF